MHSHTNSLARCFLTFDRLLRVLPERSLETVESRLGFGSTLGAVELWIGPRFRVFRTLTSGGLDALVCVLVSRLWLPASRLPLLLLPLAFRGRNSAKSLAFAFARSLNAVGFGLRKKKKKQRC